MARTALVPVAVVPAGVAPAMVAADAANGMTFPFSEDQIVHVKNGAGSALTLTIKTDVHMDGIALPDRTVTVPATTGEVYVGPFVEGVYKQADGHVYVDFSSATTVTIEVLTLA